MFPRKYIMGRTKVVNVYDGIGHWLLVSVFLLGGYWFIFVWVLVLTFSIVPVQDIIGISNEKWEKFDFWNKGGYGFASLSDEELVSAPLYYDTCQ